MIIVEMFDQIQRIKQLLQLSIIIVEQNAYMAMKASDRTYVMEVGHIVNSGKSEKLLDSPDIKKAYLGA